MEGFIDWFVESIRAFLLWEIAQATATMDDALMWMAVFNILLLAFCGLVIFVAKKAVPVAVSIVFGMFLMTIVIVALVK